jgi:hypothetical protein
MQEEEDAALARRLMEQEQQAEQQQAAQRHRVRTWQWGSAARDRHMSVSKALYAASKSHVCF